MKSEGQMSSQSPVAWWYCEVNCEVEVVGKCVEAVPVLGAESVDFLFNCCDGNFSIYTGWARLN
jgi:hypothetical protein